MLEKFQFFSLLVTNYFVAGCLLAILVRGLLYFINVNATTRHNIWLSVLLLLLLLPLQSFIASPYSGGFFYRTPDNAPSESLTVSTISPIPLGENTRQIATSPEGLSDLIAANIDADYVTAEHPDLWGSFPDYLSSSQLLLWMGMSLILMLTVGVIFRIKTVFQLYIELRELVSSSKPVSNFYYTRLCKLASELKMQKVPLLRHNAQIKTPLATGIFRPVILIPSHMAISTASVNALDQVLLHELAHLERRDAIAVVFQVFASVLLYWHPAANYVNRKINFERELACDDWVVNYGKRCASGLRHSYANTLLALSQSLQDSHINIHSLACLQSTEGLKRRILILLNTSLNHSIANSGKSCLLVLSLTLLFQLAWAPFWPDYPFSTKVIAETLQEQSQEHNTVTNRTTTDIAASIRANPEVAVPDLGKRTEKANSAEVIELTKSDITTDSGKRHTANDTGTEEQPEPKNTDFLPLNSVEPIVKPKHIPVTQEALTRELSGFLEARALAEHASVDQGQEASRSVTPPVEDQISIEPTSRDNLINSQVAREPDARSNLKLSIDQSGELSINTTSRIQEITVTTKRSLYSLRTQIRRAEKNFYATYNEYNTELELSIRCHRKEFYEDIQRSYRCWPKFFEDAVTRDAQSVSYGGIYRTSAVSGGPSSTSYITTPISTLKSRNKSKFERLRKNILAIAMEQPTVYESLSEIAHLQQLYEVRHDECMAKPAFLFVFRRCS